MFRLVCHPSLRHFFLDKKVTQKPRLTTIFQQSTESVFSSNTSHCVSELLAMAIAQTASLIVK